MGQPHTHRQALTAPTLRRRRRSRCPASSPCWPNSLTGSRSTSYSPRMPLPLGFVPPCLPDQGSAAADRRSQAARDQARRLSRHRAQGGDGALQPPRQRPHLPLHPDRGVARPPALALLHHRRRGGVLRDDGVPSFDRIRYRRHDASVFLYAFDLIELDGEDMRREPFETRKATLASLLESALPPACASTSTSRPTVRPCSPTPARWASRASCRSARPRPTAAAARRTGSRARTRRARRCGARRRRIGVDDRG